MPVAHTFRPYVILNAAMSLDGEIATPTGDSRMSSAADMRRVHRLRASVDAIVIGLRTLLVDDPKLTVKVVEGHKPYRIIVDSHARTPLASYVVRTARDVPTIIAVTSTGQRKRIEAMRERGVSVLVCVTGRQVSLTFLLRRVRMLGIRRMLVVGGGTWSCILLSNGLVDEIAVAIH